MSSTNRSDARDSHIADYYVTPQAPVMSFIKNFMVDEKIDSLKDKAILDPCA